MKGVYIWFVLHHLTTQRSLHQIKWILSRESSRHVVMTTKMNWDLPAVESTKMGSLSNCHYCKHRNGYWEDNEVMFQPEKSFPFNPFLHHSCYEILFLTYTFTWISLKKWLKYFFFLYEIKNNCVDGKNVDKESRDMDSSPNSATNQDIILTKILILGFSIPQLLNEELD